MSSRRRRLRLLASVVAVVAAGIVVVLIATGSGARRPGRGGGPPAEFPTAEIAALLAGIHQDGNTLGNPAAPVTLQYYGDLECPVCKAFTLGALSPIIQRWVRGGLLKLEYHSLQTATREPEVFRAQQVAALAAGKQDRMWNFLETFYHEQGEEGSGYVTERYIQGIAKLVPGLNLARWTSERSDPALPSRLASEAEAAESAGLNGTPAFLIGRSGGTMHRLEPSSFTETGSFDEAIEKLS